MFDYGKGLRFRAAPGPYRDPHRSHGGEGSGLAQFDVPVGQVDEVPPAFLRLGVEGDMQEWLPAGALRFAAQAHACLLGQTVGLPRVALDAGADNVFPVGFPAAIPWNHVVKVQVLAVKNFVAVLAGVSVTLIDVVACELHLLARHAVEEKQHDHAGNPDLEGHGVDHVLRGFALGEIPPAGEIVGEEVPLGGVHHLRLTGAE